MPRGPCAGFVRANGGGGGLASLTGAVCLQHFSYSSAWLVPSLGGGAYERSRP